MITRLLIICFLLVTTTAHGLTRQETEQQINQIADEVAVFLKQDLPNIQDVVPGFNSLKADLPGLVIAEFEDHSANDASVNKVAWGRVVAQLLRFQLNYAPQSGLKMPPFYSVYVDKHTRPSYYGLQRTRLEDIHYLAESMNLSHVLSGSINVDEDTFVIQLNLHKTDTAANTESATQHPPLKSFTKKGPRKKLSQSLESLAKAIYTYLVPQITQKTQHYFDASLRFNGFDLDDLAETLTAYNQTDSTPVRRQLLTRYWEMDDPHPLLMFLYWEHQRTPQHYEEVVQRNDRLFEILNRHPDSRAIQQLAGIHIEKVPNQGNWTSRLHRILQQYVRQYPEDVEGFRQLTRAYKSTNLSANALSVAHQGARVDPNHFAALWNFCWALMDYAWVVRGNTYWKDVPEEGKRVFPVLKDLARRVALIALEQNKQSTLIRYQFISTSNGYSPELRQAFFDTIQIDPGYMKIYDLTASRSRARWGGHQKYVDQVVDLAIKNNPEAYWPYELKKKYQPSPETKKKNETILDYIKEYGRLVLLAISLGFMAFSVYSWWRSGFWFPTWVHVLAGGVLLVSLGLAFMAEQAGHPLKFSELWMVILLPSLIYVIFVIYGDSTIENQLGSGIFYHPRFEEKTVKEIFTKYAMPYARQSINHFRSRINIPHKQHIAYKGESYQLQTLVSILDEEESGFVIEFFLKTHHQFLKRHARAGLVVNLDGKVLFNPFVGL